MWSGFMLVNGQGQTPMPDQEVIYSIQGVGYKFELPV